MSQNYDIIGIKDLNAVKNALDTFIPAINGKFNNIDQAWVSAAIKGSKAQSAYREYEMELKLAAESVTKPLYELKNKIDQVSKQYQRREQDSASKFAYGSSWLENMKS